MSRSLVALLEDKLVQHTITATRPSAPGVGGVDVTSWRTNAVYSAPLAALFIDGTVAATLSSPTGGSSGPELWGQRLSRWSRIGYLNDGADIEIAGDLQGFVQQINVIGIFDRLCIAATVSAGTATAALAPIDQWSTP